MQKAFHKKIRVTWIRFEKYRLKMRTLPLPLKPYWYLVLQSSLLACLCGLLWWGFLEKAWPMFFNIWPKNSLLDAGWAGVFVVSMLTGLTIIFGTAKVLALVHFRALADRVYDDFCPPAR